jgi:hypothetical protein
MALTDGTSNYRMLILGRIVHCRMVSYKYFIIKAGAQAYLLISNKADIITGLKEIGS